MTATLIVDAAGRILLPKQMRQQLNFRKGTKIKAEIIGDKVQIEEELPAVKVVRGKSGRRVIAGMEGFDAAKAVRETHEQLAQRGWASER